MLDFFKIFLFGSTSKEVVSLTFAGAGDPWLRVAVVALALVVIVISWMSLRRIPSLRTKSFIIFLRCVATAALVVMILEPQIQEEETARVKNKVVLVFDSSKSMAIKAGGQERFQNVREFLQENGAFLELLERDFDVDYLSFSGSEKLKEVRRADVEAGVPLEGQSTDIAALLRGFIKRYQERHVSGILLFSDGRDTSGIPAEEKLDELEKL
ncbi:MAG: hypothetical protein ACE5KK_04305, partial [Candidatus Brocadiales bacterium]